MTWLMTVAAGAALGYFLVQYFTKNGRVSQETGAEAKETEARAVPAGRLHKSSRDRKVAGVCGGIGEYFHIDPSLVRLGFIAFCVLGGSGLMAYLLAAIIMPNEAIA